MKITRRGLFAALAALPLLKKLPAISAASRSVDVGLPSVARNYAREFAGLGIHPDLKIGDIIHVRKPQRFIASKGFEWEPFEEFEAFTITNQSVDRAR